MSCLSRPLTMYARWWAYLMGLVAFTTVSALVVASHGLDGAAVAAVHDPLMGLGPRQAIIRSTQRTDLRAISRVACAAGSFHALLMVRAAFEGRIARNLD